MEERLERICKELREKIEKELQKDLKFLPEKASTIIKFYNRKLKELQDAKNTITTIIKGVDYED